MEASELENVQKSRKSPYFFAPLPQDISDFFEFWDSPLRKKQKLKTLKIT